MDTNAVIDFFNGKIYPEGKKFMLSIEPVISVITHIELLSNKNVPLQEWNHLQKFVSVAAIHQLNETVVQKAIVLRQNYKIKTPDAIIAATAMVNNLILISRNILDFKAISGLQTINPHNI